MLTESVNGSTAYPIIPSRNSVDPRRRVRGELTNATEPASRLTLSNIFTSKEITELLPFCPLAEHLVDGVSRSTSHNLCKWPMASYMLVLPPTSLSDDGVI
jgi:hypothetical protein